MVNPCRCGHEKGDHQTRIGRGGNYTPCCASKCSCDGFRKANVLRLEEEEAMCLDDRLTGNDRTVRVQVNVSFINDNGDKYHGTREIKIRLGRETDVDIQNGR